MYFILKDHLGSASVVTDASGNIVSDSDQRYYPYGESRLGGTMLTDKLFTSQRDVGLGFITAFYKDFTSLPYSHNLYNLQ